MMSRTAALRCLLAPDRAPLRLTVATPSCVRLFIATAVALLSAWLLTGSASTARATVVITAREITTPISTAVAFEYSGSLDLTGLTFQSPSALCCGGIRPQGVFNTHGVVIFAELGPATSSTDRYEFVGSAAGAFGVDENFVTANGFSGDAFGIIGESSIFVPRDYISLAPMGGQVRFSSSTIESLTLIPGTYTWTLPNDKVVLNIVPEPSTALLLTIGLVGIAARRRHF